MWNKIKTFVKNEIEEFKEAQEFKLAPEIIGAKESKIRFIKV
jgi:hypothetical protein